MEKIFRLKEDMFCHLKVFNSPRGHTFKYGCEHLIAAFSCPASASLFWQSCAGLFCFFT